MVNKSDSGSSALEVSTFGGRMPAGSGDLAIETHGITPVPEDNRYGTPRRLFTVWFAPQMNMTGVFTGSLAIVFGLGFWLGLLAMVIGTLLGSLPVAYLSTWGPRTGTGQLPASRMAFGATVVLPAIVQWLSSIAWDGLVGLFGGEALSTLLHIPFWVGVLIVLALQGVVGIFGYELIHRVEAVMTVVLITIDWYYRARGRRAFNPARESTVRADAIVALITFVVAFGAAVPFMDTSIIVGPVAKAWDGADVAYFVNFGVAAIIYGGYRVWRHRAATPAAALGTPAHTLGSGR
jgi:NCS1 family nucleobase:cation symporter-1